ncbi:MAG: nucleotidyltransferase domain-containing protein [Bauldia sp.]|nr:nucleotidyltransferase domain-containing protein [Bauldia sp.]
METNGAKPSTRNSIDLLFDSRRRIRFASTVAAPLKRKRDRLQAQAIAQLVSRYLTHLPYDHQELTALPFELFQKALPLFSSGGR